MKKLFGLAAIAGLIFVAAPTQQASAVSLNNPGMAATVQGAHENLTTQVQYRHRHHVRRHHGWHRPHYVRRYHHIHRPHIRPHRHHHWR